MPGIRPAVCLIVTLGAAALLGAQNGQPVYRQRDAPVEARVADLLAWMTLEEKVAQLQGVWSRKREIQNARGEFDPAKAPALTATLDVR